MSTIQAEIKEAYGKAAVEGVNLCSTDSYSGLDLSWIPDEVLAVNQGCGSPLADVEGGLRRGERVVDLGCGAGLDVFLAARQVGPEGHVFGIDMTPEMLAIARRGSEPVARQLGYANVTFEEASMEELPIESASVDTVISNCVINLSENKRRVFSEIFRVLRPGGKFVISDILSMVELPNYIRNDQLLIGKCLGGALSVESFASTVRESGLRGLSLLVQKSYGKVDNYEFLSLGLAGYKPDPSRGRGKKYATLLGPCSSVVDELGNRFLRGVSMEISEETAAVLELPRYREYFFLSPVERQIKGSAALGVAPEPGPCVYTGDFVNLVGPFTEVRDDDHHVFTVGRESEICGKTMKVLNTPLYKQLFATLNRCQGDIAARQVVCGPGTGCC